MMELNEKIQELRKQKVLTQEELARVLYVSRTAVSKWESGRGYPNIESLKAIAKFFGVTIDELLSGDELLRVAETDQKQKTAHFRDLVYGLLDCGVAMFLFLPFFGRKTEGAVQAVSLLSLTGISSWLKSVYFALVIGITAVGILTLALQNCRRPAWERNKYRLSLLLNTAGALLFIISLQPYAAVLLFVFLIIQMLMLLKTR